VTSLGTVQTRFQSADNVGWVTGNDNRLYPKWPMPLLEAPPDITSCLIIGEMDEVIKKFSPVQSVMRTGRALGTASYSQVAAIQRFCLLPLPKRQPVAEQLPPLKFKGGRSLPEPPRCHDPAHGFRPGAR